VVTIGRVSELIALGRFRVRKPTPLSTVARTSWFSAVTMHYFLGMMTGWAWISGESNYYDILAFFGW
jgi:hypothetical protein